ncbi:MAG: 16S rRNA (cytosine(1402)-N(4))-methyltransferase [Alphaproteobacteria bacterium 16-39-46]|nr:MAG: 16S rRNA (cytosine(1402)-N(4))-methyltransferase [Alphaproteobacteria bacterium 16-39-46]OZA43970.1 MAG: 16S rRNA (cytosine(1402)-N(4))-methyltransferase [Alphaproteobacteria bacterium 17-39-52]HQS83451.1 16S rRNA (cytosine(1402)-N(4))-methyltransferase RsmH [Alphaproteobacteria bacterium]HQS93245.1 16S rRNA (cytosine(1402)-N(4))-methyltransferase RsmH [Alphaproteobacteria bacterium]
MNEVSKNKKKSEERPFLDVSQEISLKHIPVMISEVLSFLDPKEQETYVDGTFGLGGYSSAILKESNAHVIAIDRDEEVEEIAKELEKEFKGRFQFIRSNFSEIEAVLLQRELSEVQGVVFDLGVSSPQIDNAERGFSFQKEGPLDMRMEKTGFKALDVVNTATEEMLADIFYHYGDETKSRRIARAILKARLQKPFTTTSELVRVVHSVMGAKSGKIDSATRVFQALRIYVNDEIGSLKKGLEGALKVLSPGGRLIIVTFHSLEDRIVKDFFNMHSGKSKNSYSRHSPLPSCVPQQPILHLLTPKAIRPQESEIFQNPRARSAKLRAALRTMTPFYSMMNGV